ncbi:MAG: Ig-like domain repeat protein, partial [Acidobacteriaceae bacterium]
QVGETSNNASVLFTIYNNVPIPCAGGAGTCGAPLIVNSITFGVSDYTVTGEGGVSSPCTTFPATISAGGNCTYVVVFTPTQAGSRNTTMTIASNDPQGPVQLPVYGTGLSLPLAELLNTELDFGNSAIGVASPPITTMLLNSGQAPLNISTMTPSANFAISANTCTGTLAPQATCSISITFTPPSAGYFTGALTITDNDAIGTQQSLTMTGTGATGPQLRIVPAVLNFGNQPINVASAAQTVTITSTGDTTVAFPANAVTSTADFILQGTTCGTSLPFGSSCTATVEFKPTTAQLPEMGTLLISDNATGNPQPIYMSGTGVEGTTASTTTLASSVNPATAGQAVTFTATVKGPSGNTTVPTGTVTFLDGTAFTTLGTGTLNGSAQATYTTSTLSAGSHSITAGYGGDTNFSSSVSNVVPEVVNVTTKAATTTAVASSANPAAVGAAVTFTATVAGPSGNTTVPTGTVTFMDGTTTLGTGTLNGSAQATYSTSALSAGSHSITAVYGGDANFSGSTSSVLTQTIGTAGYSLSVNPTTLTVTAGQSGMTVVSVTPAFGFSQQVGFTCTGLPAASSCSFSPSTVTPSGSSASTTTLTVATDVSATALFRTDPRNHRGFGAGVQTFLAVVLIGLSGLVRTRRRVSSFFCAALLMVSLGAVIAGCGGGGGNHSSGGGGGGGATTPPGTSTVTVTGTAGTLSQTVTFTLTVQ